VDIQVFVCTLQMRRVLTSGRGRSGVRDGVRVGVRSMNAAGAGERRATENGADCLDTFAPLAAGGHSWHLYQLAPSDRSRETSTLLDFTTSKA
jgi:hypothetical protein